MLEGEIQMQNKWKIVMPGGVAPAGMALLKNRPDVDAVVLDQFTTAEFHAALKDADGVGLGLTPFGEAELNAAPNVAGLRATASATTTSTFRR